MTTRAERSAAEPRDRATTRDRIIEAGRHLFWEKGFAATGLAEILARADANSGSFYHFFESKDALLRAVLDLYVTALDAQNRPSRAGLVEGADRAVFAMLDGTGSASSPPSVATAAQSAGWPWKSTRRMRRPTSSSP